MENNDILFSILIPNYGYSTYLFESVDSVCRLKIPDGIKREIIICDQSSIDDFNRISKEINARFNQKEHNINLLHSNIKGLFRARHTLIKAAIGKYIIFIDSDDFVGEDYLMRLYECIQSNNFPAMVITNYTRCSSDGKDCLEIINDPPRDGNLKNALLVSDTYNSIWRKVFLKSLYVEEDYRIFNHDITHGEDKIFSLPIMSRANSIVYAKHIVSYHYRQLKSSMVHNVDCKALYNKLFILQHNKIILPNDKKLLSSYVGSFVDNLTNGLGMLPVGTDKNDVLMLLNESKKVLSNINFSFKLLSFKQRIKYLSILYLTRLVYLKFWRFKRNKKNNNVF